MVRCTLEKQKELSMACLGWKCFSDAEVRGVGFPCEFASDLQLQNESGIGFNPRCATFLYRTDIYRPTITLSNMIC